MARKTKEEETVSKEMEMLRKVAGEMNDPKVMGLNPPIDTNVSEEELTKAIVAEVAQIVAGDKKNFSKESWDFMTSNKWLTHLEKPSEKKDETPPPESAKKGGSKKSASTPAETDKKETATPAETSTKKKGNPEALKKAREAKSKGPSRHQILFDSIKDKKKHNMSDLVKNMVEKFGGSEREAQYQIDNHMKLLVVMGVVEQAGESFKLV